MTEEKDNRRVSSRQHCALENSRRAGHSHQMLSLFSHAVKVTEWEGEAGSIAMASSPLESKLSWEVRLPSFPQLVSDGHSEHLIC